MDVANQCERSDTKRDARDPERKGEESAQNPKYIVSDYRYFVGLT